MKVRAILVCTLLLLAAVPSFARPLCAECNNWNMCESIPGSIEACYSTGSACWTEPDPCSPPRESTVLADWQVASIDVSRSSEIAVTDSAEPAETEACEAEAVVVVQK
jgi:hypothetical protein